MKLLARNSGNTGHSEGSNADVPVELLARELNCQCFWFVPIGPGRAGGHWEGGREGGHY